MILVLLSSFIELYDEKIYYYHYSSITELALLASIKESSFLVRFMVGSRRNGDRVLLKVPDVLAVLLRLPCSVSYSLLSPSKSSQAINSYFFNYLSTLKASRSRMTLTSCFALNLFLLPFSCAYCCSEGSLLQGFLQKGQFYLIVVIPGFF